MFYRNPLICAALAVCTLSLAQPTVLGAELKLTKSSFGTTREGQPAELYTLSNSSGFVAKVTNYGAIIVALEVPDKSGQIASVIQGFGNVSDYQSRGGVNGATIGRYANRIAGAKFSIDGTEYHVTKNSGANHIHGGTKAFFKVMWNAEEIRTDKSVGVKMSYHSRDEEEGFPGNLDATVTYSVPADSNELRVEYGATTDKPTVVNFTNHGYFNLAGANTGRIDDHVLMLNADKYTPLNNGIPTGEVKPVADTPLDFTKPAAIGPRLKEVNNLFDHNYVVNGGGKKEPVLAARVEEPKSGRVMEVWTTQPGVQLYTGNGRAICLEAELYPDSPNHPEFPSAVLRPGEKYAQTTIYRFPSK